MIDKQFKTYQRGNILFRLATKVQQQSENAANSCTIMNNSGLLQMQPQQQQHLGNMFLLFFLSPLHLPPPAEKWRVKTRNRPK